MQNFQALGASLPNFRASGGWGLHPQTPKSLRQLGAQPPDSQTQPPIANFSLRTRQLSTVFNYTRFCCFCFEQFYLDHSVTNLIMLIIDIYLMLNVFCLKSFICNTHCVTLIPSCNIALSYLFAEVI